MPESFSTNLKKTSCQKRCKGEREKLAEKEAPFGIILIVGLHFVIGMVGLFLALLMFPFEPISSLCLLTLAVVLFVCAIGLLELRRWAWWLTVTCDAVSLALYAVFLVPTIPLEIFVLIYLLAKNEIFGIKLWRNKQ
jgi:hypothetical protein